MVEKLNGLAESPEKAMLQKMASFYALHCIYEDKGWYLESDYMDGTKTKAIRRTLNDWIEEIRPDIGELVAAFGISDESLAAEILKRGGIEELKN